MIKAWVFYYTGQIHRFEELDGTDFASNDPQDWGLPPTCSVLLVLQHAQFQGAWLYGNPLRKW